MNRKDALAYMRIAGYHNDHKTFTRLLVENRVSLQSANEAWRSGVAAKQGGMKCECPGCKAELAAAEAKYEKEMMYGH